MGLGLGRNRLSPVNQIDHPLWVNFERSAQNITQDLRKQMQDVGNYATERIDDCISRWQHEVAAQKIKRSWLRNPLKADTEEKKNVKNFKQQADKEIKELKRLKNNIKSRETNLEKKENNILKTHKLSGKILFDARQVTQKEGVFEAVLPKSSRDLDFKLCNEGNEDDFFVAYSDFPDTWDLDQDPKLRPSLETSLEKASSSIEELEHIYEKGIESIKEKIQIFNDEILLDTKKFKKDHHLSKFLESEIKSHINQCKVAERKKTLLQGLKFCQRVTPLRKKIQSLNERIQQMEGEMYLVKSTKSGSLGGFTPLKVCAEAEAKLEKISTMYYKAKAKVES